MSVVLNPLVTSAGIAAALNAQGMGIDLDITQVQFAGFSYTPTVADTTTPPIYVPVTPAGGIRIMPNQIRIQAFWQAASGTYPIRTITFWSNSTLVGIISMSASQGTLSAPPGSPNIGDTWTVGASPTGAWAAFTVGDYAVWNGNAWVDMGTTGVVVLSAPPGSPAAGAIYTVGNSPTGAWASFTPGNYAVWSGSAWSQQVAPAIAYKTPGVDAVFWYDILFVGLPQNVINVLADTGQSALLNIVANHVNDLNAHPQYARLDILAPHLAAISVPKGAPANNAQGVVGYTFSLDGDTGLFCEGGSTSSGSSLVMRIDGTVIWQVNPDGSIAGTAAAGISTNIANSVGAEQTRAMAAETVLSNAISTETGRATTAETALNAAITAEQTRALAAEAALALLAQQGITGQSRNMRADLTTADVYQFYFDELVLTKFSTNLAIRISGRPATLDDTVSGIGGIIGGFVNTPFPNLQQFQIVYAVYNPTTNNCAMVSQRLTSSGSISSTLDPSTDPSLAGYTYSALVNIIPISNLGQWVTGRIRGNRFFFSSDNDNYFSWAGYVAYPAVSTADLTSMVPPQTKVVDGMLSCAINAGDLRYPDVYFSADASMAFIQRGVSTAVSDATGSGTQTYPFAGFSGFHLESAHMYFQFQPTSANTDAQVTISSYTIADIG